jgi:hypothetical protein
MITLMAFSVNRSNMGRGRVHVIPTYQDQSGPVVVNATFWENPVAHKVFIGA